MRELSNLYDTREKIDRFGKGSFFALSGNAVETFMVVSAGQGRRVVAVSIESGDFLGAGYTPDDANRLTEGEARSLLTSRECYCSFDKVVLLTKREAVKRLGDMTR